MLVLFFFFFKQKTAYEIPKRDWSSDVCSSDLCLQGLCASEETAQVFPPPRPVVAEDAAPDLQMVRDSFRPEQGRKFAVLVDDAVVFARGDDPFDARQLTHPFAVHVRDVGGRAVEVAVLVPVAVELIVDVVDAGEADGAAEDVGIARGEVGGGIRAETRPVDGQIAALGAIEDVRCQLMAQVRVVLSVARGADGRMNAAVVPAL